MMAEGDHESADSCRMGEVEGVRMLELVCVGRLLRMGCGSFQIPVCGSVECGEPLWEQNWLPWEHSAENQGREERQRQKANSLGGEGKGTGKDRKPNFMASSARIHSRRVVVA